MRIFSPKKRGKRRAWVSAGGRGCKPGIPPTPDKRNKKKFVSVLN
jgi:hypothetical protein